MVEAVCTLPGRRQTEERRVSRLVVLDVRSLGLADDFGRALDVEQIIGHLESQADPLGESIYRREIC